MIPLEEAQEYVLSGCEPLPAVMLPLRQAHGLVLVNDVDATSSIPPFANTAVDGFAVQAADVAGASEAQPADLLVVDTLAAGAAPSTSVEAGQAIRIMTGAPMPPGADAVVMVEDSKTTGDRVQLTRAVPVGAAVRGAGEDVRPGDKVFQAGAVLSPGHLGVLASLGTYEIEVISRPQVGVFSTGDELIEGSQTLAPGQIRDSNRHTLLALLDAAGCTAVDMGVLPDDEAVISAAVAAGAKEHDALVTSGGVSMGDFDFVKKVLGDLGDMRWMQVAIKPAKPLAFGTIGGTPIFGLPGNPVSSMVSFELFARPALRKMMGRAQVHRMRQSGMAGADLRRNPDGKTHFPRMLAEGHKGNWTLRFAGGQGSHQLSAMADANALAILPDGSGAEAGDRIEFFLLDPDLA